MKKRLLSLLTTLCLCLTLLPVTAGAEEVTAGPNWTYNASAQALTCTASDGQTTITLYPVRNDGKNNLTISGFINPTKPSLYPQSFSGILNLSGAITSSDSQIKYTITSIGNNAFQDCASLTEVILPNSVTSIGNYAFSDCVSLTSITLPEGLTSIGIFAFQDCVSLTSITLPEGLTSIGNLAFSRCSSLPSLTLPQSVTSMGNQVFRDCTSLTGITVEEGNPNYCSEDGVLFSKDMPELICYPAGKKDSTYQVPATVTQLAQNAFYGCKYLTDLTLPEGVTSIESYTFQCCEGLTSITLPQSLESIGDYAFSTCTSLTSITLPENVTTIGDYAFWECTSLAEVILPDGLTTIGDYAFSACTSLTSITLPQSVTSIGNYAFQNCTDLKTLTLLSETPPTLEEDALDGCSGNLAILVPPESVEAYKQAEGWKDYAVQIEADQTLVTDVTVTPETLTLTVGGTGTLIATVAPENATDQNITWASSNSAVATVEANSGDSATVTAVGAGTAKITITADGGYTASCTVTVTQPISDDDSEPTYAVTLPDKVTGGEISVKKRYAQEGETFRFTVTPDEGWELDALAVTDSRGTELTLTREGGGTYSFTMPARQVSIGVSFRKTAAPLPFTDVPEGYWARDEIAWAYENGYMSGTAATTFNPGGTVSRQQVWMILARMAGAKPSDMAEAKAWAVANGISDGTDPGAPVTRQQLAALLYRYAVLSGYDVSVGEDTNILSYTDVGQLSEYAIPAMQWACGAGIINGTGDGSTLTPQGASTRAQLAVMLYRWLA